MHKSTRRSLSRLTRGTNVRCCFFLVLIAVVLLQQSPFTLGFCPHAGSGGLFLTHAGATHSPSNCPYCAAAQHSKGPVKQGCCHCRSDANATTTCDHQSNTSGCCFVCAKPLADSLTSSDSVVPANSHVGLLLASLTVPDYLSVSVCGNPQADAASVRPSFDRVIVYAHLLI